MAGLILSEHYGHGIQKSLERFGVLKVDDKNRPNYWALYGWTNTLKKMRIDCDIVFLGNSTTVGSDFQAYFQDRQIVNLGYSGDDILGMSRRIKMVSAVHPDKIFVATGRNDLLKVSVDEYLDRYDSLITALQNELPYAKIYLQSVLPVNHEMKPNYTLNEKISTVNKQIKELATKKNCTYIELYELFEKNGEMRKELTKDGVHLFPESYQIWADAIKNYVYE